MTLTVKTITMETTANRRSPLRKVHLRSKEMHDYQLVKNYVDHGGRIAALALRLNCSERTARRKINGYKQYGIAFGKATLFWTVFMRTFFYIQLEKHSLTSHEFFGCYTSGYSQIILVSIDVAIRMFDLGQTLF